MGYLQKYKTSSEEDKNRCENIENEVANIIIKAAPENNGILIGNMLYGVTKVGDKVVPAYCYRTDYFARKNGQTFADVALPIWDRENTLNFGWSDFTECCRIFDMVVNRLNKD